MVKFLKDIEGVDFTFKKGEVYKAMKEPNDDLKGFVLVKRPSIPGKKDQWNKYSLKLVGKVFDFV